MVYRQPLTVGGHNSNVKLTSIVQSPVELKPNTRFDDRYVIQSSLGSGSYGSVYRGYDDSLGRDVAIKILSPLHSGDAAQGKRQRFVREGRVLSKLQHPNIVQVHRIGVMPDGRPFIVMDLVNGRPLSEYVRNREEKKGRFTLKQATRLVIEIASALSAAHAEDVVHRDIKPENVLVTESGGMHPLLIDFGLSALTQDVESRITVTGDIMGTPDYMSPEQCLGERVDARSDIYGLGCVYFEMLTGRTPFGADNPLVAIANHVSKPIPDILQLDASRTLPQSLQDIFKRMLAKKREERYQSCAELIGDLEHLEKDCADDAGFVPIQDLDKQVQPSATKRTRRWILPVFVAVTLAVTCASAVMLARNYFPLAFGNVAGATSILAQDLKSIRSPETGKPSSNDRKSILTAINEIDRCVSLFKSKQLSRDEARALFETLSHEHKQVNAIASYNRPLTFRLFDLESDCFVRGNIPLNSFYVVREGVDATKRAASSLLYSTTERDARRFDELIERGIGISRAARFPAWEARFYRLQAYRALSRKEPEQAHEFLRQANAIPQPGLDDDELKEYQMLEHDEIPENYRPGGRHTL